MTAIDVYKRQGIFGALSRRESGVPEQFGIVLHDGQRRLQLMRYVGNEIRLKRFDAGELLDHSVEV